MLASTTSLTHTVTVDAWLSRVLGPSRGQGSSAEVVALFCKAGEVLWQRAVSTLGTVTLTAIANRALYTAASRYPFLATLYAQPNGQARWGSATMERLARVPRVVLLDGLRFTLIDLLAMVGRLTAEILSEDLHATLLDVEVAATLESSGSSAPMPFAMAQTTDEVLS